ncbi:MAG: ABC transporter permease [Deltaproteobacteria bacterium]|nr:ABC transporter permease [Deltaproteobacteria bacterium]MBW2085713.1 ABC transporter permease [Deltaproteobacteria bacterium]
MRLSFIRIGQIIVKEFRQALRDPRMRVLLIFPPLLQLILFGYAANLDLKNIPTAIYDEDRSSISRDITTAFSSSGYFKFTARVTNEKELTALIDRGKVKAALHFGPGLAGRVKSGRTAQVQIIVSGTDSNTAAKVQSYALQIIEDYNRTQLEKRMDKNPIMAQILPAGVGGILQPRVRIWYNPDLSSVNFYVPGIIAMIIMLVTLTLTSMAVVREKEIGTMEQIMVTPIKPFEFILGKTIPFSLIGFIQVTLVTTVGVFWFGVPMRGSLLLLAVSLVIYLLSTLGIGLLISTISRTQQQALFTTFFFFFPAILLSGFIFPIANMPRIIQFVTYLDPLRYALVIIRGIFLKGVGLDVLWPQLAALLAIGLILMTLAVSRLRKTLD